MINPPRSSNARPYPVRSTARSSILRPVAQTTERGALQHDDLLEARLARQCLAAGTPATACMNGRHAEHAEVCSAGLHFPLCCATLAAFLATGMGHLHSETVGGRMRARSAGLFLRSGRGLILAVEAISKCTFVCVRVGETYFSSSSGCLARHAAILFFHATYGLPKRYL
jgi:hypothetical protein